MSLTLVVFVIKYPYLAMMLMLIGGLIIKIKRVKKLAIW